MSEDFKAFLVLAGFALLMTDRALALGLARIKAVKALSRASAGGTQFEIVFLRFLISEYLTIVAAVALLSVGAIWLMQATRDMLGLADYSLAGDLCKAVLPTFGFLLSVATTLANMSSERIS